MNCVSHIFSAIFCPILEFKLHIHPRTFISAASIFVFPLKHNFSMHPARNRNVVDFTLFPSWMHLLQWLQSWLNDVICCLAYVSRTYAYMAKNLNSLVALTWKFPRIVWHNLVFCSTGGRIKTADESKGKGGCSLREDT